MAARCYRRARIAGWYPLCSGLPPKKSPPEWWTRTAFKWRGGSRQPICSRRGVHCVVLKCRHIPAASVLDQTRIAPVTRHVSDGRHDGAERSGLAVIPKRPFHWGCHCTDRNHAVMAMDCLGLAGSEHSYSGYGERQKGPHGGPPDRRQIRDQVGSSTPAQTKAPANAFGGQRTGAVVTMKPPINARGQAILKRLTNAPAA